MVTLVEREYELRSLWALFNDDDRQSGQVAVVRGPVGSGKTELVETIAQLAVNCSFRVYRASGSRQERTLPFGILGQLIDNDKDAQGYAQLASPSLNDLILSSLRSDRSEKLEQWIYWHIVHVWRQVLSEASRVSPVLIIVDDVHHADHLSLTALLQLLRRSRATSIRMLFTICHGAPYNDPLSLYELRRQPSCRTVRLNILSLAGVARVLTDRLGSQAVSGLVDICHSVTGGNPLLVHAFIDDKLAAGTDMPEACDFLFGEAFQDAVLSMVQQLDSRAPSLVNAIAVLGESGTPERLSKLLDLDRSHVIRLTQTLKAAEILAGSALRHTAIREAIRNDADPSENEKLSSDAAQLLHAEGAPVLEVAWHLLKARPTQMVWAAQALQEAAEQARVDGQSELAVKCLELAHRSCPEKHRDPLLADRPQASVSLRPAVDGCGPLSSAERRVASLAAQGHTNREIAAKLFITVSTVEQHLTRIYRKLEVKQRKELSESLRVDSLNIA
jgi:DNA-binding CsgD family transcriptional regulator